MQNHKVKGVPLGKDQLPQLLPNTAQWIATHGLVIDGAAFLYAHTRRAIDRARGLPEGDYASVPDADAPAAPSGEGSPVKKKAAATKGPQAVEEERDESVHSSKQKIKVVISPTRKATAKEPSSSDDDELVE